MKQTPTLNSSDFEIYKMGISKKAFVRCLNNMCRVVMVWKNEITVLVIDLQNNIILHTGSSVQNADQFMLAEFYKTIDSQNNKYIIYEPRKSVIIG